MRGPDKIVEKTEQNRQKSHAEAGSRDEAECFALDIHPANLRPDVIDGFVHRLTDGGPRDDWLQRFIGTSIAGELTRRRRGALQDRTRFDLDWWGDDFGGAFTSVPFSVWLRERRGEPTVDIDAHRSFDLVQSQGIHDNVM